MSFDPNPDKKDRADVSRRVREEAARLARQRVPPQVQRSNGEADALYPAWGTFTKGLKHDDYGIVSDSDVEAFRKAFAQQGSNPKATPLPGTYKTEIAASFDAPFYEGDYKWPSDGKKRSRGWESPLTGHVYDLQGPDADQVEMPPAPRIGSDELTAEMAELYAMALLRDTPFGTWSDAGTEGGHKVAEVLTHLNKLSFFKGDEDASVPEPDRTRTRLRQRHRVQYAGDDAEPAWGLTPENLFRGSTKGAQEGPYISQFLLVGNKERPTKTGGEAESGVLEAAEGTSLPSRSDAQPRAGRFGEAVRLPGASAGDAPEGAGEAAAERADSNGAITPEDGVILYGIQAIPQRWASHRPGVDHMTDWASWHDVQNGSNRKGFDLFDESENRLRFCMTGRDLATYVHFDQLYQAYLNACLMMLSAGMPTDVGLPEGGGVGDVAGNPTRDAFASFGGPHVLTLVTEVATRALKAVRRQKFNIHLRARPEALAGALTLAWNADGTDARLGDAKDALREAVTDLEGLLKEISSHNIEQNQAWKDGINRPAQPEKVVNLKWIDPNKNALLPMAFPEGSPMHGSYGAGHATVAGACVTILKAFFEMYELPSEVDGIELQRGQIPHSVFAPELRRLHTETVNKDLVPAGNDLPETFFGKEIDMGAVGVPKAWEADPTEGVDGTSLRLAEKAPDEHFTDLSVQGELDKLAANIAIGRDFAGVHYYTDYYESLRMGERVAVGLLQEQMLTYREPVSMRFRSFDGDYITIVGSGGSREEDGDPADAVVSVWDAKKRFISYREWWNRAGA